MTYRGGMTDNNSAHVVPIGKYKGEPVEVLLADQSYTEWLLAQPWFPERYAALHQTIINYGAEPQDSPEHNEMQLRYLDDRLCLNLAAFVGATTDKTWHSAEFVSSTNFEVRGWDVVVSLWTPEDDYPDRLSNDVLVELKPDLGDDFPTVLRQIKSRPYAPFGIRVVVVRRASFRSVTWGQVQRMYKTSGIQLAMEAEIDAYGATVEEWLRAHYLNGGPTEQGRDDTPGV